MSRFFVIVASSRRGEGQRGPSFGAWGSAAWYFFSRFEAQLDNVVRCFDATSLLSYSLVLQLHVDL